jgi:hypothetical protein
MLMQIPSKFRIFQQNQQELEEQYRSLKLNKVPRVVQNIAYLRKYLAEIVVHFTSRSYQANDFFAPFVMNKVVVDNLLPQQQKAF